MATAKAKPQTPVVGRPTIHTLPAHERRVVCYDLTREERVAAARKADQVGLSVSGWIARLVRQALADGARR